MKRALIGLLAVASVLLVAPEATAHHRPNRYCSESGDLCLSAARVNGERKLRIGLAAKYFDHYTLCVATPENTKKCKRFAIHKSGVQYGDTVNWAAHFPPSGPGAYSVTWRHGGNKLGRTLGFHVH